MNLHHIIHRPVFITINESIGGAKELFLSRRRKDLLSNYKDDLIDSIDNDEYTMDQSLSKEEQIRKIRSGEADREILSMMTADPSVSSTILSDVGFNAMLDKIKENTLFGPTVLAIPMTKMYLRYGREDLPDLLNLITSLNNSKLKTFLKGRNIDLGKTLNDYAEMPERDGIKTYELFSDYIRDISSEVEANWLIKELKVDAAMGPERNLPPFNQVEAYRSLAENDPLRARLLNYGKELEKNKNNPAVAAAIQTIKKKIAAYDSLEKVADFVRGQLDAALKSPQELNDFLKIARSAGKLAEVVYNDEHRAVVVAYHEIALGMLFPMSAWCILPSGWGGGRNMWKTYINSANRTIQFAVMDFSKSSSNNMRCWAFTYNTRDNMVTHAHAKDDVSILSNFQRNGLADIFSEKESIVGYYSTGNRVLEDSSTFTIPQYALEEIQSNLSRYLEITIQNEGTFKLRNSNGTEVTDFTTSTFFKDGGLFTKFLQHSIVRAKAALTGASLPSFIQENKNDLDTILVYLTADVYSNNYKNKKEKGEPTLVDTFILPFIKVAPALGKQFVVGNFELAEFILKVLKNTNTFEASKIYAMLKKLNEFIRPILTIKDTVPKASPQYKNYSFLLSDAVDTIKVFLHSLNINEVQFTSGKTVEVKKLEVDNASELSTYITNLVR